MSTFKEIALSCSPMNEANEVRKSIFYDSKGKMTLGTVDEEGSITELTWEQYKKSGLNDTSSDNSKKDFLSAMLKQVAQFNKKVDYNTWVKRNDPTWEEKIDYLIKNCGSVYKKSGIKSV